jgi:anti-sigma factor RsiW
VNCERARRLANDIIYLAAGEAAAQDGAEIPAELEEHLWSCPNCRAEMAKLRALRCRLRALGNRPAPDDLASRTMSAIRLDHRHRAAARRSALHLRRALAAAAAAAAIAAGGAYLATPRASGPRADRAVSANVAPLVMEYADYRGAQPLGDRDAMALVRARMKEQKRP